MKKYCKEFWTEIKREPGFYGVLYGVAFVWLGVTAYVVATS